MSGTNRFTLVTIGLSGLVVALFVASLVQGPVAIPAGAGAGGARLERRRLDAGDARDPPAARAAGGVDRCLARPLRRGVAGATCATRSPMPACSGSGPARHSGPVLALYTGLSTLFPLALPLAGLLGAIVAVVLVLALSGREAGSVVLILSGVAVSGLAGGAHLAGAEPFAQPPMPRWRSSSGCSARSPTGRCSMSDWRCPSCSSGWVLLAATGRGLDALTLGRDTALSLGIRMDRLRLAVVLGTAAAVGAGVAVAGSIGFVGLVVPHLLRPFVGNRAVAAVAGQRTRRRGTAHRRRSGRPDDLARQGSEARRRDRARRHALLPRPRPSCPRRFA